MASQRRPGLGILDALLCGIDVLLSVFDTREPVFYEDDYVAALLLAFGMETYCLTFALPCGCPVTVYMSLI